VEICCECWEVTPLAPPRLIRHCPGCNATRPFVCAGTFRVNAQKKTLDAWLNYRCERCGSAWKCPIVERRPVGRVDPLLLEAFFRHDPIVARQLAFDLPLLRRQKVPTEASTEVTVRRATIAAAVDDVAPLCIRLSVPYACTIRLDQLLARQLGLSRAALRNLQAQGEINVSPENDRALRAAICDGQRIWIGAPQLAN